MPNPEKFNPVPYAGNNVLHRASYAIEDNPQAPEIIEALLDLKLRPNAGALFNYNRQLPLHVASSSTSDLAPRCLEMLADAYIPGAWAQVRMIVTVVVMVMMMSASSGERADVY
jgi:hypothetical protein